MEVISLPRIRERYGKIERVGYCCYWVGRKREGGREGKKVDCLAAFLEGQRK
jgi:hypothetical protein